MKIEVVVIGAAASGKTQLIKRLLWDSFSGDYTPTIGNDIFSEEIKPDIVYYDIPGEGNPHAPKALELLQILHNRTILLCYNFSEENALDSVKRYYATLTAEQKKRVILVGLKSDLKPDATTATTALIATFAQSHKLQHYVTSTKMSTLGGLPDYLQTIAANASNAQQSSASHSPTKNDLVSYKHLLFWRAKKQSLAATATPREQFLALLNEYIAGSKWTAWRHYREFIQIYITQTLPTLAAQESQTLATFISHLLTEIENAGDLKIKSHGDLANLFRAAIEDLAEEDVITTQMNKRFDL